MPGFQINLFGFSSHGYDIRAKPSLRFLLKYSGFSSHGYDIRAKHILIEEYT